MLKLHARTRRAAIGLLMGLFLGQAALASYPIPPETIGTGTIGTINYAARTLTVNGHAYPISSKAVVAGAQNFEGLQSGMRVQFIMNGPVNKASSQITSVIVLPARSQP